MRCASSPAKARVESSPSGHSTTRALALFMLADRWRECGCRSPLSTRGGSPLERASPDLFGFRNKTANCVPSSTGAVCRRKGNFWFLILDLNRFASVIPRDEV